MDLLQKLDSDLRAEVLAAQLLQEEQDFGKVIIERLGNIARTYTKDVYNIFEEISKVNLDKYIILQSFRQSLYEAIPENVFHPPTLGGLGKSKDEIIEEIKYQRQKEQEARTFFMPFEQEAPYIEVYGLMLELMYEKKGTFDNFYELFQQAWPVLEKLPRPVALSFIYILPVLNEVRGKKEWIAKCLHFITGFPVDIEEVYTGLSIEQDQPDFVTGSAVLGTSSTLSGKQDDGFAVWILKIGPVPYESAPEVLPHSGFEDLLDALLEYMAPAHIFINKKIIVEQRISTELSSEGAAARLGYTFTI